MAYVTIPKDLTKVKSKVLFGLTKRQLICFGAAALIGVPLFFLLRRTASNSAAAFCMIIVMLPFFLLAMYERHGQPLEVVAGQVIRCMFLRTKERPYQTNNFYVALERQAQAEKEVKAIVQKAKARAAGTAGGKAAVKLTAAEKREISRILETARGDGKVHSAQDTLPFRQMYPDGLCKLDDHTWSKCIEFEDVNYQLAKPDDQTAIFEALCDMYNAHDASIGMQLSLVSRRMNREDFVKRIEIAAQGDHFDHIRELYTQMLRKQLERGNNGLIKTKYLTLTIEARDSKTARARFSRIVMDALNHFKVMGALAKELDGKEWLEMLHGILHPDGERFAFEWSWLAPSGLSVQDFIAPSSFRFGEARKFTMADKFCAVSFLQISAPEMDDRMLTELLDTDSGLLVSLHIRSMDQNEAIKTVKRKITDIDSMKIDAQKKAVREGFDMDIIPTDLATYAGEAKNILRDLQSRNERMFLMTFLVVNFADSKQKLENDLLRAASVAQKYNCSLVRLDFQQEDGFVSALPLGVNRIKIQRGLTTSAVAVFVPFTTQEIFHGGEALYYGLNATSGNMILADRKKLKTPNGMILGTPGSGKSFPQSVPSWVCS